jgi:hypothetical protein
MNWNSSLKWVSWLFYILETELFSDLLLTLWYFIILVFFFCDVLKYVKLSFNESSPNVTKIINLDYFLKFDFQIKIFRPYGIHFFANGLM